MFLRVRTVSLLHESRWKLTELVRLMHKVVQQSRNRSFHNEHTQCTPFDPKLMFWCVLHRFVTARKLVQGGMNWCDSCTSSCNEVMLEFLATSAPSPQHWTLNSWFVAFHNVLLLHESRCKTRRTGATNAQALAMNTPDTPHVTRNSCFGVFQTALVQHESQCKIGRTGATNAQIRATKLCRNFSQLTYRIHPIGP
jgi:hypothetical protein